MIGQTWPSEMREFRDPKTGRRIKQLTTLGNNVHFYFTENSFDSSQNAIIFKSDRASGEDRAPHEDPRYDPTWSWDGSRILYASDAGGRINLYLIEL